MVNGWEHLAMQGTNSSTSRRALPGPAPSKVLTGTTFSILATRKISGCGQGIRREPTGLPSASQGPVVVAVAIATANANATAVDVNLLLVTGA
ncbi:hypothetical protein EYF80_047122 [Liparis tanakae]|uniref:Uncharacterized protein n=1 Tax=Liparis tanakae TaxID=230148 RepID=A0A4Z2FQR1_9TELE|nr:hypothetical protein EYF80_047122 [Liparis tanakae]